MRERERENKRVGECVREIDRGERERERERLNHLMTRYLLIGRRLQEKIFFKNKYIIYYKR